MKEAGYTAIAALIHFDCTAAGAAVLAELRPRPDQIERIDIATYRFASVMRNPDPPNYFASKYSLPQCRGRHGHQRKRRFCRTRRLGLK